MAKKGSKQHRLSGSPSTTGETDVNHTKPIPSGNNVTNRYTRQARPWSKLFLLINYGEPSATPWGRASSVLVRISGGINKGQPEGPSQ